MPNPVFTAILTVLDRATAPLRAIEKSVSHLHESASKMGEAFGAVGEKIGDILRPLEALGAAASIGGLVETTRRAAEMGAQIYDAALKTGIGAEQLSAWHYAARESGVEADQFDKAMVRLNRSIAEAAAGKNKEAASLFAHLGISVRDAQGHLRSAADILPQLSEGFRVNESAALRDRMAMVLMSRAGADLLPMLVEGRGHLDELTQSARVLGLTFSDEAAAGAKKFEVSWKNFEGAIEGVSNAIGSRLFPLLQPMLDAMTQWIVANRALISQKVGEVVTQIADALRRIDWADLGRQVAGLATAFASVIGWLGPTGTAIAALAVFVGPLVVALGVAAQAVLSFGIALMATPVGWVVAGIAAIALAAYEIYAHWTPISAFFKQLWADVVGYFEGAWAKIQPIIDFVEGAASRIGGFFSNAFANAGGGGEFGGGGFAQPPGQRLYGAGGGAASAAGPAGANGRVQVDVNFSNAPPGTQVNSRADGGVDHSLEVGYGFQGAH